MKELEEGRSMSLDFTKIHQVYDKIVAKGNELLPVVLQDVVTMEVLFVGYTNKAAFELSIEKGRVVLWSTTRDELWIKGNESGNWLELVEVRVNCEQNSLLYLVKINGTGACHVKKDDGRSYYSCYYRKVSDSDNNQLFFV